MSKIYSYLIIGIVGSAVVFFAGMYTQHKLAPAIVVSCPPCPTLRCPPNVTVNSLPLDEVRKLKIKGGFTFAPVYNGTVMVMDSGKDTLDFP